MSRKCWIDMEAKDMVFPPQSVTAGCLTQTSGGLTKRELMATMILAGMVVHPDGLTERALANLAVTQADELIARLEAK
jgi:hypothetical protein